MTARAFSDYPPELQAAVNAYDGARRELANSYRITGRGEPAMSDANKATIAPMIQAAVRAYVQAFAVVENATVVLYQANHPTPSRNT